MPISSPTPESTAATLKGWVTNMSLILPDPTYVPPPVPRVTGRLSAVVAGYNSGILPFKVSPTLSNLSGERTNDTKLNSIINALIAECITLALISTEVTVLSTDVVSSLSLSAGTNIDSPVQLTVSFTRNTAGVTSTIYFKVTDCFHTCSINSSFSTVFTDMLLELARQSALTAAAKAPTARATQLTIASNAETARLAAVAAAFNDAAQKQTWQDTAAAITIALAAATDPSVIATLTQSLTDANNQVSYYDTNLTLDITTRDGQDLIESNATAEAARLLALEGTGTGSGAAEAIRLRALES